MSLGTAWHGLEDDLRIATSAAHWRGAGEPFSRGSVSLRLRRSLLFPFEVRISAGGTAVSSAAPTMVWPGAGTGEVRSPLLRGHPLTEDGAIAGPAFGRRLVHATGELRLVRRFGPLLYGGSIFLDVAKAWDRSPEGVMDPAPPSALLMDPGVGLFLNTGDREIRVDVARGETSWGVTAGVRSAF